MDCEYSHETISELEKDLSAITLFRPIKIERYEPGTQLSYDITAVASGHRAGVQLVVEKFVGGGFAGQVYQVRVLKITPQSESLGGLDEGNVYAMKILIPPSGFSCFFRNVLYWIGFQGPFQPQVNPAAARAGALWQKMIRRGAKIKFGDERSVVDIYATFVDGNMGSCGELSEWVDGRTWRLEVDEHMDLLGRWKRGKNVELGDIGSPEYRAKHEFMHQFVELLHDMGGHEFARQYEWSTCKSQPNGLKRNDREDSPSEGLTAVDFRAGLALLPVLPMSPGDFKLIAQGLKRKSLVQFDRGDIGNLEQFMGAHENHFSDMRGMLGELKAAETTYRESIPDITHNHFHLLYKKRLWSTILTSSVVGWKILNIIDERFQEKIQGRTLLKLIFFMLSFLPFLGHLFIKVCGHSGWRKHYFGMLTRWRYLKSAVQAKVIEKVIVWHRSGRISSERARLMANSIWRISYHLPISILPVGLHRFMTDWEYAKDKLVYLLVRPIRLYFNSEQREQWLRDMVTEGKEKQLLTDEDAEIILSQVKEPFIQKYLKSLAVHICTLPVTQVVSVIVAVIYVLMHPEMPRAQSWGIGLGIIALFQVVPISPGSLVRGLYVVYLVIRDKNFKDYNIAVFLGFFKYIGYLAFPIQMGYRYPVLAQFMAAHWATEAVHAIPVFGERGALLEHGVFCLFYNWPLTIRRRMHLRSLIRSKMKPRYWHIILCTLGGLGIFKLLDFFYLANFGESPESMKIWWVAAVLVPLFCGAAVTLGAGGATISKRFIGAAVCGGAIGVLYTVLPVFSSGAGPIGIKGMAILCLWRVFIFTIFSTIGVILTELSLPEPNDRATPGMARVDEMPEAQ